MANATAMIGSSWMPIKPKNSRKTMHKAMVCRISSDPYRTLRIRPDASESEVKTAFRRLALKYHPDVCKGNNCGVKFQTINEAYDILINNLRASVEQYQEPEEMFDEREMREEWMGSEAGWVPNYAAHMKFSPSSHDLTHPSLGKGEGPHHYSNWKKAFRL